MRRNYSTPKQRLRDPRSTGPLSTADTLSAPTPTPKTGVTAETSFQIKFISA
ncbi:hypothetical protein PCASD_06560, partial [Puccinia coronata f. sp. avenae]